MEVKQEEAKELWCSGCRCMHQVEAFGVDHSRKRGRQGMCRLAQSRRAARYRRTDKGRSVKSKADSKYYAANREAVRQRKAKHYAANREAIQAQQAKHYAANREAILERAAKYRRANLEAERARDAKYRHSNKGKASEATRLAKRRGNGMCAGCGRNPSPSVSAVIQ